MKGTAGKDVFLTIADILENIKVSNGLERAEEWPRLFDTSNNLHNLYCIKSKTSVFSVYFNIFS